MNNRFKTSLFILLIFCLSPYWLRADSAVMDSSFGRNGTLAVSVTPPDEKLIDVLIDSGGGITAIVSSYSETTRASFAILYGFDADGRSTDDRGKNTVPLSASSKLYSAAIQSDGKIILGGLQFIKRVNADGSPDTTFGADQNGTIDLYALTQNDLARVYGLAVQADGKIIVAGDRQSVPEHFGFCVMRFNTDGTLDTTFDGDGKAFAFQNTDYIPTGVVIGPTGKILLYSQTNTAMAQFLSDGSLDASFGTGGTLIRPVVAIDEIVFRPDGKMVVCGPGLCWQLNTNGSKDTTFGTAGEIDTGHTESVMHVALQDDGKIVMAGPAQGLLRYTARGQPDSSFASSVTAPGTYSAVNVLKILSGNKILLMGTNSAGISQMGRVLGGALEPDAGTVDTTSQTGTTDVTDTTGETGDVITGAVDTVGAIDGTALVVNGGGSSGLAGEAVADGNAGKVSGAGVSGTPDDIGAPAEGPSGTGDGGASAGGDAGSESAGSVTHGTHAAGGCSLVR